MSKPHSSPNSNPPDAWPRSQKNNRWSSRLIKEAKPQQPRPSSSCTKITSPGTASLPKPQHYTSECASQLVDLSRKQLSIMVQQQELLGQMMVLVEQQKTICEDNKNLLKQRGLYGQMRVLVEQQNSTWENNKNLFQQQKDLYKKLSSNSLNQHELHSRKRAKVSRSSHDKPQVMVSTEAVDQSQVQECHTYSDLEQLPLDRLLNTQEINVFKGFIGKKRKLHIVFNEGIAKKIRLEPCYHHFMTQVGKQGRCVLCSRHNRTSWPKYKCKTCGVYLCRAPKNASRLSCHEKWHSRQDLTR